MKPVPVAPQVSILSAMELIWNLCEILFVEVVPGENWSIMMLIGIFVCIGICSRNV